MAGRASDIFSIFKQLRVNCLDLQLRDDLVARWQHTTISEYRRRGDARRAHARVTVRRTSACAIRIPNCGENTLLPVDSEQVV